MEGKTCYLAYNLHGDPFRKKIYSANFQTPSHLIPWGTEVRIVRVQRNFLTFRETAGGREWGYWFSGRTRRAVSLKEHLDRLFIEDLEGLRQKVESLSEQDRDGIYEGRPMLGMSRRGVLIAMGYPPEFANPKDIMQARDWLYWLSRFDRIKIGFNRQGLVSSIVD
ncbi:MAG: hypothetical protein LC633_03985, partial [Desulfobulbaceae bacterium]|nr:hypothetical protein [Desulfobulbaceae bacterium]